MAAKTSAPANNDAVGFVRTHKKWFITAGSLLLAVVLLLIILHPSNSPTSVFGRYLDCLRSENDDAFRAVSYDANFSNMQTADGVVGSYQARFASADSSYQVGGRVNLLKDTDIRITKTETPKKTELTSRRTALAEDHRNTERITDIRNITFEIKSGDQPTYGSAEMICVTGKWYIGDVSGI